MFIHWFPGHMKKAYRMMEAELSNVDSIIYVLDSRAPLSCLNPYFDKLIANKPIIYVLNKADMVERGDVVKWKTYFEGQGKRTIITNSVSKKDATSLIANILAENSAKIEKYLAKGVRASIRAIVIGVPNSGKSTLINSLIPAKKAVTGNRPGVTRGKQWVAIDKYVDLLDSPGVLFPDFSNQYKARNLAFIGSIKDDILDTAELSKELFDYLYINHLDKLKERYKMEEVAQDYNLSLIEIAKAQGMILRGGEADTERAAKALITDFRKLKFGRIMLEKSEQLIKVDNGTKTDDR